MSGHGLCHQISQTYIVVWGKANCQLIGALTSAKQANPEKFDDNPNSTKYIGMTASTITTHTDHHN